MLDVIYIIWCMLSKFSEQELRRQSVTAPGHGIAADDFVLVVEGVEQVGAQNKLETVAKRQGATCAKVPFVVGR